MFATIFRLGPLVLLELGFAIAALAFWLLTDLSSCYCYTLSYLAIITFLIEMVISLRMMKKSSPVRRQYLCKRLAEPQCRYYLRLVWDNVNIALMIMLLYSSLIADGLKLSDVTENVMEKSNNQQQISCEFSLFALCLFEQLEKALNSDIRDDLLMMWLLYAATTFITSMICLVFGRQYYQYCSSISTNRRISREIGTINETMLDCHIYSIKSEQIIDQKTREEIGVCSICIHELLDQKETVVSSKVVKLRCQHLFHKECIDKWLAVKDSCPYRCSGTD